MRRIVLIRHGVRRARAGARGRRALEFGCRLLPGRCAGLAVGFDTGRGRGAGRAGRVAAWVELGGGAAGAVDAGATGSADAIGIVGTAAVSPTFDVSDADALLVGAALAAACSAFRLTAAIATTPTATADAAIAIHVARCRRFVLAVGTSFTRDGTSDAKSTDP